MRNERRLSRDAVLCLILSAVLFTLAMVLIAWPALQIVLA